MPHFPFHALRAGLVLAATPALTAAAPAPAQADSGLAFDPAIDPASAVAVVVQVPKPWYVPRAFVVSRMRDTLPQYAALPGLAHKAYSFAQADGSFGGLYLWKDQASARAHFGPAWFERVERERGVPAQVRLFEVPVAVDNTTGAAGDDGAAVGTLVTLPMPAGATRAQMVAAFRAAVPQYRQVPGLLHKDFILTADRRFGGLYLWKDEASARQWFGAAWKETVLKTYGTPATIEWFDTPILLPSTLAGNRPAIPGL